jgi:hypothetical protein
MPPTWRIVVEAVLILWLLFPFWRMLPAFSRWIDRHPTFAVELGLLFAILFGLIGVDYGLRDIFWHERWWTQFRAGISVGNFLLVLVGLTHLLDTKRNPLLSQTLAFLNTPPGLRAIAAQVDSWAMARTTARAAQVAAPVTIPGPEQEDRIARGNLLAALDLMRQLATSEIGRIWATFDRFSNWVLRVLAQERDKPPEELRDWPVRLFIAACARTLWLAWAPEWTRRRVEAWAKGRFVQQRLKTSPSYRVACSCILVLGGAAVTLSVPAAVWSLDEARLGRFDAALAAIPLILGICLVTVVVTALACAIARKAWVQQLFDGIFIGLQRQDALSRSFMILTLLIYYFIGREAVRWSMPAAEVFCLLLVLGTFFSAMTHGMPLRRIGVVVFLLILVARNNGNDPYKLSYPGLELDREHPEPLRLPLRSSDSRGGLGLTRADPEKAAPVGGPARANDLLIDGEAALARWLALNTSPGGAEKPRLVVVATSGGGIAAAVWTALNLARLEQACPTFPARVRVITGASGGMLGASAYVATLRGPPATPRPEPLQRLVDDLCKDSLTPVVRQMVLHDLPSILQIDRVKDDRGRALERAWEENTQGPGGTASPLSLSFRSLARGEAEGWRPSLIVAPMIVEEVAPLLISNLDLGYMGRREFFKLFPARGDTRARRLKISTAIRMNAAFPLVSPATCLPTDPPRRVVDAGYFDNYGVTLAADWISHHREWIVRNTSGVILIQIRAYSIPDTGVAQPPTDPCLDTIDRTAVALPGVSADRSGDNFFRRLGNGMQWLTTPMEGYTAARKQAMLERNDAHVRDVQRWFHDAAGNCFFRTFVLECPESAALSWYLTRKDRKLLEQSTKELARPEIVPDASGRPRTFRLIFKDGERAEMDDARTFQLCLRYLDQFRAILRALGCSPDRNRPAAGGTPVSVTPATP